MEFIETPIFTKKIKQLLTDDEYRAFQDILSLNPDSGALIVGSGGLRKIRWAVGGKGKSGGIRVIYYHITAEMQIYLLFAFAKNDQADLTSEQVKQLRDVVAKEFK